MKKNNILEFPVVYEPDEFDEPDSLNTPSSSPSDIEAFIASMQSPDPGAAIEFIKSIESDTLMKYFDSLDIYDAIRLYTAADPELMIDSFSEDERELAEKAVREALEQTKESVFLIKQAISAMSEGRLEDCAEIFQMILKQHPGATEVKEMLANIYGIIDRPNKAISAWRELYEHSPDNIDYSMKLAIAYFDREWYRKAAEQFERTIALDSSNVDAWEYLCDCYYELHEYSKARTTCYIAIDTLKAHGIESLQLYSDAFYYTDAVDTDSSLTYLEAIVALIKSDDRLPFDECDNIVVSLLEYARDEEFYEMLPYIREMTEHLPEISQPVVDLMENLEMWGDFDEISSDYPDLMFDLLYHLITYRQENIGSGILEEDYEDDFFDDFDDDEPEYYDENYENNILAMECSILNDLEGYSPFLVRLKAEYPKLFSLHDGFFNEALSGNSPEALLHEKVTLLAGNGFKPSFLRADGTEDKKGYQGGTFRRDGPKIGRNDPCPCGSGKKYKKCCGA